MSTTENEPSRVSPGGHRWVADCRAAGSSGCRRPDGDRQLRKEIDYLDAEILRLVKRRTEVSRIIGATRMASGGTRIVVNREMDVLARYRELGPEGRQLAMVLLNLGQGPARPVIC